MSSKDGFLRTVFERKPYLPPPGLSICSKRTKSSARPAAGCRSAPRLPSWPRAKAEVREKPHPPAHFDSSAESPRRPAGHQVRPLKGLCQRHHKSRSAAYASPTDVTERPIFYCWMFFWPTLALFQSVRGIICRDLRRRRGMVQRRRNMRCDQERHHDGGQADQPENLIQRKHRYFPPSRHPSR